MEVNGYRQLFGYKLSLNYLVCVCVQKKNIINGTKWGWWQNLNFLGELSP